MRFALSRRQRWDLANLLLGKELQINGLEETKAFNRTRLALGLTPIMDAMMASAPISAKLAGDTSLAGFDVEQGSVDFLLAKIVVLPLAGHQAATLAPFYEALETAKLTKQAPPCDLELLGEDGDERETWAIPVAP